MSDLEKTAIERIRAASQMSLQVYQQPLVITDSGGKDSSVCVALAQAAGIAGGSQRWRSRHTSAGHQYTANTVA